MEEMRQPLPDHLRSQRQAFLRRAADLLRKLNRLTGPDDRETRLALGDLAAAIELRRHEWLPE
jgi:hypothetical protein